MADNLQELQIGIPVALGVHGGTGAIFAVVKARPAWYSPIVPLVFIISALASGGTYFSSCAPLSRLSPKGIKSFSRHIADSGGFLLVDLSLLQGSSF